MVSWLVMTLYMEESAANLSLSHLRESMAPWSSGRSMNSIIGVGEEYNGGFCLFWAQPCRRRAEASMGPLVVGLNPQRFLPTPYRALLCPSRRTPGPFLTPTAPWRAVLHSSGTLRPSPRSLLTFAPSFRTPVAKTPSCPARALCSSYWTPNRRVSRSCAASRYWNMGPKTNSTRGRV